MFATAFLAVLPLLASATPPGRLVHIESVVRPDYCVQMQTYYPPRNGLTVYLGQWDGGSSQYAHSTFFAPEVDTPGAIYFDDEFCIAPANDPTFDGGRHRPWPLQ